MGLIRYWYGDISCHYEPIHVKFGVWGSWKSWNTKKKICWCNTSVLYCIWGAIWCMSATVCIIQGQKVMNQSSWVEIDELLCNKPLQCSPVHFGSPLCNSVQERSCVYHTRSESEPLKHGEGQLLCTSLCNVLHYIVVSPHCNHPVVRVWCNLDAWTQLCVSCITLPSTLPVFIHHSGMGSISLVLPPPSWTDSPVDLKWKSSIKSSFSSHPCVLTWEEYRKWEVNNWWPVYCIV